MASPIRLNLDRTYPPDVLQAIASRIQAGSPQYAPPLEIGKVLQGARPPTAGGYMSPEDWTDVLRGLATYGGGALATVGAATSELGVGVPLAGLGVALM